MDKVTRKSTSLASIYVRLIRSRIRSQVQYRSSFVMAIVGNLLVSFLDFLGILVFFHHVPSLGGWKFEEIAFLYGSSYIGMRFADMAVGHIEQLPQYIRMGTFDTFLMRPLGSLFQMTTGDFSLRQLGGAIQGSVIFGLALGWVTVAWTFGRVAMVAITIVSGAAIFSAVWIIGNAISFWLIDTREIANAFTYGGNFVNQYPLHIFSGWIRRFVTVVVPIAFVNYFPSLYILGREAPFGASPVLSFISPVVAAVTSAVAWFIWRAGVRHYRSTGS